VRLSARFTRVNLANAGFRYQGVAGPKGSCSEESFRAGHGYVPRREDVFVVTQMKCGTTWMQHVVYQVLLRGRGTLAEEGKAMYAVSPWLEGTKSVPIAEAPLIGSERPSRIIKTHFPADLCPLGDDAKYVYVVRHPVSCFASCADFLGANLGAFAPDLEAVRDWYCSDEAMWWGSWPRHVEGWWKLSRSRDNVLFVRFEDMKADLAGVTRRVADFLGMRPLSEGEIAAVVEKCGFEYMRAHDESFEMQPPHVLAIDAELLVKGTADRYRDVPTELRREVMEWCQERLAGGDFPLAEQYPPK
jgi:estrone sulfotransferase